MTSSSFVERPTPRAHRQCRRRSPPTGWSSRDLIPNGTPPPPLDAVTGNRTRGPSPPRTTPTTPRSCCSRGRHHRLQRRPHPQKPHPTPTTLHRSREEPAPLTRRRHGGRRRGGEPSPRPPAGEDAEQLLSRSVESAEGEGEKGSKKWSACGNLVWAAQCGPTKVAGHGGIPIILAAYRFPD